MDLIILILLGCITSYIVIAGTIRVFSNNFWLALLMLFLLPPLLIFWVLVEGIISIFK
jgi:hypothetical protein